ncbi:protein-ER retention protein [Kickxella alabastrina]|nr:protein-ER retention protein [Kickxella alabastrina]
MYFPAAFQVLFLTLLAAFGWAANLRYLSMAGIEVRRILQLSELPVAQRTADRGTPNDGLHQKVFRLATVLSCISLAGWLLCVLVATSPRMQTYIALVTYVVIGALVAMPQRVLCHTVRMQFVGLLVRIATPSLSEPVFLSDVIMADILTSCARTFADLFLVACQFSSLFGRTQPAKHSSADIAGLEELVRNQRAANACADAGIVGAILVALPYMFRLRQCVNEYVRAVPGGSDGQRHFANAVKYASSIPVICLSATQRRVAVDGTLETKYSDWALRVVFSMWIVSVAFNSLYSYYWDVALDWSLGHMDNGSKLSDLVAPPSSPRLSQVPQVQQQQRLRRPRAVSNEEHNVSVDALDSSDRMPGSWHAGSADNGSVAWRSGFPRFLRPRLCFGSPEVYYVAMAVDFLLRITWTMKLTSYVQIDLMAYGGFWLNVLEIYRRWQWTFLRIEKEAALVNIDN